MLLHLGKRAQKRFPEVASTIYLKLSNCLRYLCVNDMNSANNFLGVAIMLKTCHLASKRTSPHAIVVEGVVGGKGDKRPIRRAEGEKDLCCSVVPNLNFQQAGHVGLQQVELNAAICSFQGNACRVFHET